MSNLGMLGVDSFIAIINPPQSAILAAGRMAPRVITEGDGIEIRLDDDSHAFRGSSRRRWRHWSSIPARGKMPFGSPGPLTASMAKLPIRNLTKTYNGGEVVALKNINLEVDSNESLCILGPSGCGKTTLLRIIDCLDYPRLWRDRSWTELPSRDPRPDVAMVFQHFGLFPWKRLVENIAYGLELRGSSKKDVASKVERYLQLMGLKGFEKSYPHQLSGGMQQRAGLARALAINPSLLLMDEPFGSLDAQTREMMQEELLRILETEQKTMIFVTHSIDEAILLGDRIVMMSARPGRLREIVPVDIPRPRKIISVRAHPRYIELRSSLWQMLMQDADHDQIPGSSD